MWGGNKMSKQEVYAKIFKALLEAELLNEEGVDDLQRNVEEVIGKALEDYTLVYTTGIITE